ncbi:MAG: thiamine ABC transporter substrate-binding protein [Propionibacteriaceae bacterium]|jgi:thiamine transport system substrate-binding protein|nr:thiamine ABC transporter substrate-binding protein [Propionibacteriaceae bacterium]
MRKLFAAALLAVALAGCAAPAATDSATASPQTAATTDAPTTSKKLTVLTHQSFALSDELKAEFAKASGLEVEYLALDSAGALVNQLVLTKDAPLGDVVFGIDNTFAGRAIEAGILRPHATTVLSADTLAKYAADDSSSLTPVDYGDVCLNIDDEWFAAKKVAPPATLDDLVKPEYKDLLVVTNPATSSPGLAFLVATVGAKGDPGYLDYWKQLAANGVKVVKGWEDAYYTDFTAGGGKGTRPIVLSYASSPMYGEADDGTAPTSALPKTCFRQIEYAGVVKGGQNEAGAGEFIDFLVGKAVQSTIPDQMYMSPVNPEATVPAAWEKYTGVVTAPIEVDAATISSDNERWIKDWTQVVVG